MHKTWKNVNKYVPIELFTETQQKEMGISKRYISNENTKFYLQIIG